MGASISTYVSGVTTNPVVHPSQNGQRVSSWPNRRLRNRMRRNRRAGQAQSSGLFSVNTESGAEIENSFRYPPTDTSVPYLGGSFLLGDEKHDRPMLASPMGDTCYAFGDNYDLNILAGKCSTINLPATIQELADPSPPLRALINIRRDSLRLVKCKLPPGDHLSSIGCYNVEFVFDSLVKCGVTVHYLCQEANNDADGMRFVSHPQAKKHSSSQYVYAAGPGQHFFHPEHVLDASEMKVFSTFSSKPPQPQLGRQNGSECTKRANTNNISVAGTPDGESAVANGENGIAMYEPNDGVIDTSHFIPMVVHCVCLENESESSAALQSHATFLFLERAGDTGSSELVLKCVKQKVWIGGASFLLQEIFGIENKHASGLPNAISSSADIERELDDDDEGSDGVDNDDSPTEDDDEDEPGNDCVICMSEPRDTMILPCRHLCICSQCAESLRYQANNCPICRAPFKYLLQLRPYLRQTALEQTAQLHAQQGPQHANHPDASISSSGYLSPTVVVNTIIPANTSAERNMSVVPGDSDADDDDVAVDLGKKKARDRTEPPKFVGYTPCALIDTLNGTKQAYDAIRTAAQQFAVTTTRGQSKVFADDIADDQIYAAHNFMCAALSSSSATINAKHRENDDADIAENNSDIEDGDVNFNGKALDAVSGNNDEMLHDDDHRFPANTLTHHADIETGQRHTLSGYSSSAEDEADGRGKFDGQSRQLADSSTPVSRTNSARARGVYTAPAVEAVSVTRTGSGHSNVVLLSAGEDAPHHPIESSRKY